ncbi:unnamed protein product [Rotaria magnacalcarata]|uniref:Alkaline ceramidase n=1 Tax=Rotaria magnacalcarata TaxID=392030 RepID=A0A815T6R5_9BILA|nr:unnamed protein product [Rotaria magnacalcarata]CAF1588609.1 unnamed protein product [Rotaria magnacalcarata]CAF1923495.1 unnamed protein product [Rotaria magnacalcarata]CAF2129559.1 unnamed protein product [Rotaria magnacalcarata]CAF2135053.1 unnamed protein product [Rotaria magnacalcarata]
MYLATSISKIIVNSRYDSPFQLGSSTVDWCEPNYVVSEYIAEFWNTVSNVFFFLVPPFMIILFRPYSKRVANGIGILWIILIVIGAGSVYFHATLSLAGQLVDEISILWVLALGYALFLPAAYLPQSFRVQRHRFVYSCIIFASIITGCSFVYPYANAFALMTLGLPAIFFIVLHLLRSESTRIKSLGIHCFAMWVIAVTIWISDRMFCSYWLSISFPYLHSIWHVLILFSSNQGIVICGYLTIKQQNPQVNLHLHYWPNEQWKWLSLPYLKFHDEDNDNLSTKSII